MGRRITLKRLANCTARSPASKFRCLSGCPTRKLSLALCRWKAGNAFKISHRWSEAAEAFLSSADCYQIEKCSSEAINVYREAPLENSTLPQGASETVPLSMQAVNAYNEYAEQVEDPKQKFQLYGGE